MGKLPNLNDTVLVEVANSLIIHPTSILDE
jgi:hypothetical protein